MRHIIFILFKFFMTKVTIKALNTDNVKKTITPDFKLFEPFEEFPQEFQKENRQKNKSSIFTVYAQIGDNIILKCKPEKKKLEIFWFRYAGDVELINNNSLYYRFRTKNEHFLIQNFETQDSGIYFCIYDKLPEKTNKNYESLSIFAKELLKNDKIFRLEFLVTELESFKRVSAINNVLLDTLNDNYFDIFHLWTNWTECKGSCESQEKLGIKSKRGFCFIRLNKKNSLIINNSLLERMDELFGSNGWSCYLSIHYNFLSKNLLSQDQLKDFVTYEKCNPDCLDKNQNTKNEVYI